MPENNDRMARRQLHLLTHDDEHRTYANGHGHGCVSGETEDAAMALNTLE